LGFPKAFPVPQTTELLHLYPKTVICPSHDEGMSTNTSPFVRSDLLLQGMRPASIQTKLRSERWEALYRAIYVDATLKGAFKKRAISEAHLLRAGPLAALSHHSAAALHGFDTTTERPLGTWIVAPHGTKVRCPAGLTLVRSRMLHERDVEDIDGLRVTSRARTVLDLASVLDIDELERVIESALRGHDRKRPDRWRTSVLAELEGFVNGDHRRPGASALALCLARRGRATRPTGSIAETAMIQELRRVGITEVIRQPTIRIVEADGRWVEIFPDILAPTRQLILEVDGGQHREPARHRADLARQNKLLVGFELVRCTGADALFDGARLAQEVAEYPVLMDSVGPYEWNATNRLICGMDVSWSVKRIR
jgi:very-short-patch-repair endonuclease